jgi:hypothetical protein
MTRKPKAEGSDSAYEYQNALSSCCTTALTVAGLGALAVLIGAVILGAL